MSRNYANQLPATMRIGNEEKAYEKHNKKQAIKIGGRRGEIKTVDYTVTL